MRRGVIGLVAALAVVVVLLAVARYVVLPQYRPPLRAGELYGIDVSRHQGTVDWDAVAADGVAFAYLKATEGATLADVTFARNWAEADRAGLRRGAYHFLTLCRSGAEQAAHFLATAPPDDDALPPAVDLELGGNCSGRPSPQALRAELDAFLAPVERAWGRPAVLYTNAAFEALYPVRDLGRPMWEATYYRRPSSSGPWVVWQVTSVADVDGVDGGVDLDVGRLPELTP